MDYLTSLSYWQGCFMRHVLSFRVTNNSIVKPLFFAAYDKCLLNIQNKLYYNINTIPTTLVNLIVNRAIRYEIDFSHLLFAISESNLTCLDVSNFVTSEFVLDKSVFEGISQCRNLTHLDLYGFQVENRDLLQFSSLKKLMHLSIGCLHLKSSIELNDKFLKNFSQLSSLSLCNFNLSFSNLEFLPFLTALDLVNCEISQNTPLTSPPPLKSLAISNQSDSIRVLPDISAFCPTLEILRISLSKFESVDQFFSQNFPKLIELEIIWSSVTFSQLSTFIPESFPQLKRLIFFHSNIPLPKPEAKLPYELVSNFTSPPQIMELIMNHFHHPDVAAILAIAKSSKNTFFWSKGRMGSRARITPHFLILAHVLFLNPKCKYASHILKQEIAIHKDLVDLEVICGEDYVIPLLHYLRKGDKNCIEVINYLHLALEGRYVCDKRLQALIAETIFVKST